MRVNDEGTGYQDLENRENEEVKLEHDFLLLIIFWFAVVNVKVAEQDHGKDADSLKQKDTDEFSGAIAHHVLDHVILSSEPSVGE